MQRNIILLVLAAIAGAAYAQANVDPNVAATNPAPLRIAEMRALIKDMQKSSELWLVGKDDPNDPQVQRVEQKLSAAGFDVQSAKDFKQVLGEANFKDPRNLYVITRLLTPAMKSTPETARELLPPIRAIRNKYTVKNNPRFQELPQVKPSELKELADPPISDISRLNAEGKLKLFEKLDDARTRKFLRDRPSELHNNRMIELERIHCTLMLLADDPKEDQKVVEAILADEGAGLATFLVTLEVLTSHAPKMDQARAAAVYKSLAPQAQALRYEFRSYLNLNSVNYNSKGMSTFERQPCYTGIRLLTALNVIGAAAKQPPVVVPTDSNVVEWRNEHPDGVKRPEKPGRQKGRVQPRRP